MAFDLIVIGGGYWGAATAYEARRAGLNTLVVDDEDPAGGSVNASGVVDCGIYSRSKRIPQDWLPDLEASFDWLKQHTLVKDVPALFWNCYNEEKAPTRRRGRFLVVDNAWMSKITRIGLGKVKQVKAENGQWRVITDDSDPPTVARKLVIAAGYRTDELLFNSGLPQVGVKRLAGRGWILNGVPKFCEEPLMEIMIGPYQKYMVRQWGNTYHLGDTAEREPNEYKANRILTVVAKHYFKEYDVIRTTCGFRPVTDQAMVVEHAPGLVVAVGGYRMGLGLSGLVANRAMGLIGAK